MSAQVEVDLGSRSYPIYIGQALLSGGELRNLLKAHVRGKQAVIVSNETVNTLYGDAVREALSECEVDTFLMPDGEAHKTLEVFGLVIDFLIENRHNRTSCIIALGGGVVGDLAGFSAAAYQRGIDFVQIPTTLLAQVDSSVGGKTAVNHPGGKNMVGAFYQPNCVVIDTDVLTSLPAREFSAGLAEVVKYGVIADPDLFAWLEANADAIMEKDARALTHIIKRSCEIKADVVAQDERESGIRAILNFGHTFGHAIENLSGYGTWLHGEAVAVGMAMAADFSEKLNLLAQGSAARVVDLLKRFDLPTSLSESVAPEDMIRAMGMDKKVSDGQLRFVVARSIGAVEVTGDYRHEVLAEVLSDWCRP